MDLVSSTINVLKEPRGFIRVLQFVFAIVGFATTTNFSGSFGFTVQCLNSNTTLPETRVLKAINYPFRYKTIFDYGYSPLNFLFAGLIMKKLTLLPAKLSTFSPFSGITHLILNFMSRREY